VKPGASLRFSAKPRAPRKKANWFTWDSKCCHSSLVLSSDGLTLSSTVANYQPCFGTVECKSGVWEYEVKLTNITSTNFSVAVGFAPVTSKSRVTSSQMIGYTNHIPGWAFAPYHIRKYHNRMEKYGTRRATTGDVIRVRLDLDKRTLEFWNNGEPQGTAPAFTDVVGPVVPAISLYNANTVQLQFPK